MATEAIPIGTDLTVGECYTFCATVPSNPRFAAVVNVRIGSDPFDISKTLFLGQIGIAPGEYCFDFDFTDSTFDTLFLGELEGAVNQLENMSISKQEACEDVYCSECYVLSECELTECEILLQWTNNEDGLGFNYSGLGFIQQVRVNGGLRVMSGTYEDETFYTTSNVSRGMLYSQPVKQEELWIHDIPDYLHDAIRIGLAHDHFFINGVEYVKSEGGYQPDHDVPLNLLSPVVIPVQKKGQNTFNQNC